MSAIFYVYILFKPWDGEPFYVGKGKGRRWLQHESERRDHYNPIVRRILAKTRRLGLEIPKVKIRDNLTESQAFEIETAFIKAIGRNQNGGPLANNTDGGEGVSGYKFPQKIIEKIRSSRIGMICDPEWRAKVSKSLIGNKRSVGRVHSDETRNLMSISQKKRWENPEYKAKMKLVRKKQNGKKEARERKRALALAQWDQCGRGKGKGHLRAHTPHQHSPDQDPQNL